jgi:hypothetical protein
MSRTRTMPAVLPASLARPGEEGYRALEKAGAARAAQGRWS